MNVALIAQRLRREIIAGGAITGRFIVMMLLCSVAATVMRAQQLGLRNFSTIDVGGGKQNWDVDQDEAGRMLFANNDGLLVFDGYAWAVYHMPNHTICRSVKWDSKRKVIFVGASDEFGYFSCTDSKLGLEYHSLSDKLNKREKPFGEVWKIAIEGEHVCFKTKNTVYNFDKDLEKYTKKSLQEPYTTWKGSELLRNATVKAIMNVGGKRIIATGDNGLFVYDGTEIKPYDIAISSYLKSKGIFCAITNGSIMAFGTLRGGLVTYDVHSGSVNYANTQCNLQDNTVLAMTFDNTNNLWLCLDNGVAFIMPKAPFYKLFNTPQTGIGTGYASLVVGNSLYLGTNQGLFCTSYPFVASPNPIESQAVAGVTGQIWKLFYTGGTLLCGADKGAYIIRGMQANKIEGIDGTWQFVALSKHKGFVLVNDYKGFAILERQGDSYKMFCRPKGFNEVSGNIVEDNDGTLWLSHWQRGVYHFALSEDLRSVRLLAFYGQDKGLVVNEGNIVTKIDGRIYVSSVDGLYRYDANRRKLVYDKSMGEIFNTYGIALNIEQTPDGQLWARKGGFLALAMRGEDGKWTVDSLSFGRLARQLQVAHGDIFFLSNETAIFNCNTGFMVVDQRIKNEGKSNRLMISSVTSVNNGRKTLYTYTYRGGQAAYIDVKHTESHLRISYVMPEYRNEQGVVYSVFMEHFDNTWSEETTETFKEYALNRGTYVFHVKARNLITGKTEEKSITIYVAPAWYESWCAIIVYIALLTLVIYYLIRHFKHKSMAIVERMAQENEHKMSLLKNEQLEKELKHRSCELADSTLNLVRKNDTLQLIDTHLVELSESVRREDAKSKITRTINDIRHDINESLADDSNWDKFERDFDLVYDDFMKRLRKNYPDLNKTDLKLSAYLRMNLSSKEIASLLNISVRSVETARYRLRKKLGLNAGTNLTDFICGLNQEWGG